MFTIDNRIIPNIHSNVPNSPNTHTKLEITQEGVENLLKKIDPRKASGPDRLPNIFLKTFYLQLAPTVTAIFRQSLKEARIPSDWKASVVVPVHKKGTTSDPLNYRPIALTSVLCKQMEHIVASHIRTHLDKTDFLVTEQHGFRSKRSCESQLILTIHNVLQLLDLGNTVDCIVLDFSKAFDTVCHSKLIAKLQSTGLSKCIVDWIREWLKDRVQCVKINSICSSPKSVISGVPQGSVLGPLLFLIYINDITSCVNKPNRISLFADDAFLFGPRGSLLQQDLSGLYEWSEKWQLRFNIKKCQTICLEIQTMLCMLLLAPP